MTEMPVAGNTQNSLSGAAVGGVTTPPTTGNSLSLNPTTTTQTTQAAPPPPYPKDTPVENMTTEQQAAYWRDIARKHEKAWQGKVGRDLTPEAYDAQLKELESLRAQAGTESDRAIAQARKEERAAVAAEYGPKLVRAALGSALAGMAEADRNELMDSIDPTRFLTDKGDVDTAKVQTFLTKFVQGAAMAPGGRIADHGAGKRSTTMLSPREAGLAEAKRRFGDKVPAAK
jgi:hypothetical protein